MAVCFPNETPAYRAARNALLKREIALRAELEAVAEARRALPPGGEIPEDYPFTGLGGTPAPLSSLFGAHDTLALYSFMYASGDERPCPACTSLVDGWNGLYAQILQRIALVCVSAAAPEALAELRSARNWRIPFVSAAGTAYQHDYFGETPDGAQRTFMNLFTRNAAGTIRHFWGSEVERADLPGHPRHLDTIWPIWGLFDLTPEGRGDFFPSVSMPESPDVGAE